MCSLREFKYSVYVYDTHYHMYYSLYLVAIDASESIKMQEWSVASGYIEHRPLRSRRPTQSLSYSACKQALFLKFLTIALTLSIPTYAVETVTKESKPADRIEQVTVVGSPDTLPGSVGFLSEDELDQFNYSDINQAIGAIPGVYVREEDGYGLRPNIGIRGAAADRSQKITIMEDGVLIAPAPYSAPAAYYVPNIGQLSGIEVLKGPSAIKTGPHTVGGAVNLITRPIPDDRFMEIEAGYGTNAYHDLGLALGGPTSLPSTNFLISGLSYGTDGFKELTNQADTGFIRNDLLAKLSIAPESEREHRLTLKLAYANEDAEETYLGLTDIDFRANPIRRYDASQLARFQSEHYSFHLNYGVQLSELSITSKVYWHQFDRSWNKLDGFVRGRSLLTILESPHLFAKEYALLTGQADSQPTDDQTLEITNNDRSFQSSGIQSTLTSSSNWLQLDQDLTIGLRIHKDSVRRNHKPLGYLMQIGSLVWDGIARDRKAWNEADSTALAAFASDEISFGDLSMTLGLRFESIDGESKDLKHDVSRSSSQTVLTPSIGMFWQAVENIGFFAGIYQGFSPAGPGSDSDPEHSVNIESGIRFRTSNLQLETVAFLSNYENLLGRCRVSDADCIAGQEFNGGEATIRGLEFNANLQTELTTRWTMQSELVYTLSDSAFETGFLSGFSQWGLVRENDELPYLPRHRGLMRVSATSSLFEFGASLKYQSQVREESGHGPVDERLFADSLTVFDLTSTYKLSDQLMVQLVAGNVLNAQSIVSHRPFGARPNRPRWLMLRLRASY